MDLANDLVTLFPELILAALVLVIVTVDLFLSRANKWILTPLTVGGLILGILGFIGGPITMFKGLTQMGELLKDPGQYDAGQLAVIAGIKIVALLVAASALFRGGRVFPAAGRP